MTWTTADADLRRLLSDGATDRLRFKKKVIGVQDSSNKFFKTFEYRRITNLKTTTDPNLGVFVNNVKVTLESDDLTTGIFKLSAAPTNTASVYASYYYNWFLDAEITAFLVAASNFLGFGGTYSTVSGGLQNAALKYAQHDAYQKLALRFAESLSSVYKLEDVPDEKLNDIVRAYKMMSDNLLKEAIQLRDDYYTRQGQAQAPRFATLSGSVTRVEPNR